jgi:hypothetical protein
MILYKMKVFEEINGSIFTSEEEKAVKEYKRFLEKKNTILSNTDAEIDTEEDILDDKTYRVVNSNCKSKTFEKVLITSQNEITKDTSKKLGRKTKDLTGTGIHGGEADDNQRDSKVYFSVKYLRELASEECKNCKINTLEEPNIKQQYGSSFHQNLSFLNTKLYKILCFQRNFNDDKIHKDKGSINKNIIMQMLGKKNNGFFVSLMKVKLMDYKEIEQLIKKNHLFLIENDKKKLITFISKIKSLIDDLNTKKKKARKDKTKIKKIDYITIEELED